MAMSDAHRKALDRSLEDLAEDLVVLPAIIHLRSKDFLTENDEETINARTTEKEKVLEFVKILKKRGDGGFQTLKEYLENCRGAKHLARTLDRNLQEVEDTMSGLKIQAKERKIREAWQLFENKVSYIRCEYDSIERFQHIPDEINLLMIGKTGSGKSATANTVLGFQYFKAGGRTESVTKTIDKNHVTESRFKITVIDTPGLFDTARDFGNEDLMLEIAKTVVNYACGIHLFLFVCSSNVRFTQEEQDTIATIEKILTMNVYNNCVVVLSNARAQFGGKNQDSLRTFVDAEKKQGGRFADLLKRVGDRIVAVENQCDDDVFMTMHRQRLLCYLAQIISENKGRVYSNKLFENAKKRVEKEAKERQVRLEREKNLTMMRKNVGSYLVTKYLGVLTEDQLHDISNTLNKNVHHIMVQSGVKQLEHITKAEVLTFLETFVRENVLMITKLLDEKAQEKKRVEEMRLKEEALNMIENINKMQSSVLTYIGNYLRKLAKQDLETLMMRKEIPPDAMSGLKTLLKSKAIKVDEQELKQFIQESFFENLDEIKGYIEEQKQKIKMDLLKHEMMIKIGECVGSQLAGMEEGRLRDLGRSLDHFEVMNLNEWGPVFLQPLGSAYDNRGLDKQKVLQEYLAQNVNLLNSHISSNIEKIRLERARLERQRKEREANAARENISNVIDSKLKTYLTGKSNADLVSIKNKINNDELPNDIYDLISRDLVNADKEALGQEQIKKEILLQIKDKQKVIEKSIEDSRSCFPGSCVVQLKSGDCCKISSLEVNDEVLVYGKNGGLFYDKVYLLSHASSKPKKTYVHLHTQSGKELHISPGHLLPVGHINYNVPASNVSIGDVLLTVRNGQVERDIVTKLSYNQCVGVYCPMTISGTIVVNGVIASCYTTFVNPRLAHALLFPVRIMFSHLPLTIYSKMFPYDQVEGMPLLLSVSRAIITKWRSAMG